MNAEEGSCPGTGFCLDHRQSTPGLLSRAPSLTEGGPGEGGKHRSPRRASRDIPGLAPLALHQGLWSLCSGRPSGEACLFSRGSKSVRHKADWRQFCVLPPDRATGRGSHKATWQGDQGRQASTAPLFSKRVGCHPCGQSQCLGRPGDTKTLKDQEGARTGSWHAAGTPGAFLIFLTPPAQQSGHHFLPCTNEDRDHVAQGLLDSKTHFLPSTSAGSGRYLSIFCCVLQSRPCAKEREWRKQFGCQLYPILCNSQQYHRLGP